MFFSLQKYLLNRIKYKDKISLINKNIYILPTKGGLFFSIILILMLFTAINFSNSLIFLVTFFLASMSIISMLYAQKNLLGLSFHCNIAKPVFCKQAISIPFVISTSKQHNTLPSTITIQCGSFTQSINLLTQTGAIDLLVTTKQRGYFSLPPMTISSTFPFGLFYAWSIIKLNNKSLVYPHQIKNKQDRQLDFSGTGSNEHNHTKGTEDFTGLDKFVKGQSLNKVHWKAYAKQQGMYIKNYSGNSSSSKYWFDIEAFDSSITVEKRLSYLTYLISDAEKNGHSYGLKINQHQLAINHGKIHKHQCLKMLALYKNNTFKS